MSMKQYDQWRKDNPDWDKDWSQGTGGTVSAVGDVYSKTDGGWNEVLSRVVNAWFKSKTSEDYTFLMPARKKKTSNQVGVGMTAKQLRRKKPYNSDMMIFDRGIDRESEKLFASLDEGKNVYTYGVAGTGKTLLFYHAQASP